MTIASPAPAIDEGRIEEFANRVVADASATTVTVLSSIGDRLGLWRALAGGGPAMSAELAARTVADVGCGTGRALIRLAQAFPNSRFHGYDVATDAVERARQAVRDAGVADRVEIRQIDESEGLPSATT